MKQKIFPGVIALLMATLLFSAPVWGQTQPASYIPSIIPPSPNAASLMKFTDVPVSPYTGTADITVPVYTIQAKGLSVPITLAYHTGGIKVKEEAGWVGLGWALNAGGMISRTIMDQDDFGTGLTYFTSNVPQPSTDLSASHPVDVGPPIGAFGYDFMCSYLVSTTTQGNVDYTNAFANGVRVYDMEPDIFSYNFLGHSGKFIISRNKQVILQKQDNIVINFESNGNSFSITDDQGNKYFFYDKEYMSVGGAKNQISSWLLSKIVTQQNDVINFTYANDNTFSVVAGDITETYTASPSCTVSMFQTTNNNPPNYYLNQTLQAIDFSNGEIQFSFDGARNDLQNGKKLNAIKIYSKDALGNLTYVKEHDFFYSYFNGTFLSTNTQEYRRLRLDSVKEVSGTLSIPAYSFLYNSPSGSSGGGNGGFGPGKHSNGVDHWGYYNGWDGNSSYIPAMSIIFNNQLISVPGANREPTAQYIPTFALQQINYPTGGYTVMQYEPNDYDWQNSQTGPQDFPLVRTQTVQIPINISTTGTTTGTVNLSGLTPLLPANFAGSNIDVNVAFIYDVNGQYTYNEMLNRITFDFTGPNINLHEDAGYSNLTCGGPACSIDIPFVASPTNYTWKVYIDPSVNFNTFSEVHAVITFQQTQNLYNSSTLNALTASGLRIKTITDYAATGQVSSMRRYSYSYMQDKTGSGTPQQYTFGRLMANPSYAWKQTLFQNNSDGSNHFCFYYYLTSSSNSSITSTIQGNIVGYDQVAEFRVDPVTGNDIGQTIYKYFNSPDTTYSYSGFRMPGVFNMGNNLSGSLLSKTDYVNNGGTYTPVSETDNFYHTANRSVYFSPKYYFAGAAMGGGNSAIYPNSCPNYQYVQFQAIAIFYPSLKSERILLDSTRNIIYDQLNNAKTITGRKYNFYDNPRHYQPTRTYSFDSKGNTLVTVMKYPQDYLTGTASWTNNTVMDSLIGRNMVSEVIEKSDSIEYLGSTSGAMITGAELGNYRSLTKGTLGTSQRFRFDLATPLNNFQPFAINANTTSQDTRYRQLISFDSYDTANNINQYTPVDQTPVSIIWDYKNVYPVAQIKNAMLADVAFTSFEADGTGGWTVPSTTRNASAITGTQSYSLSSGSISKPGLTIGKSYTISYWGAGASVSVTGASSSSRTGRTVGAWTYTELSITPTATTVTLSGTGSIDELRLYPAGALMTSYTYNSLVGVTAMNDPNSEITYYEYDALTRLKNIKDYQGNIIKNFQYNYGNGCNGVCGIAMETFSGSPTLSYPVGVFNVNGQLVGNASTQAQYVTLWNGNPVNQALGTLSAGSDSMHFNLALITGKLAPSYVTGCRYYQLDLNYNKFDAIRNVNGAYVDFGDGKGMRLGLALTDTPAVMAANTTHTLIYSPAYNSNMMYYVHTYPDTTLKTITIYHNDAAELVGFDNSTSPATSLTKIKNLRGYFPQFTSNFTGSSYQQASMNSVSGITNWNSINTITNFNLKNGDNSNPWMNLKFAQDFMTLDTNLNTIITAANGPTATGYRDTTWRLSKLKSNWNTYFSNLQTIVINDDHWNRENLSGLLKLTTFVVNATTQNHQDAPASPYITIPSTTIDNIINQIAAGSGQYNSNGLINIFSAGPGRTSASDASVALLQSKNWTIIVNNATITILPLTNFAGNTTFGYPVGVFNVNGKLLGNVTGHSGYVTLWNSDTANNHRGTLAAGPDSLHFYFTALSGAVVPTGVTGCRYYQYDLPYNKIDGIRSINGEYVDFGDGTGMYLGRTLQDTPRVLAANTTLVLADDYYDNELYAIHSYPDSTLKTITFYHNDGNETMDLDNAAAPANSLSRLQNLRGNCPQFTTVLGESSYRQASAQTVANITNWSTIKTVNYFHINSGDGGNTVCTHLNFAQDFMALDSNLQDINTALSNAYISYFDSTFKISRLKSNWNTFFTNLQTLSICDDHWSRESLSALTQLSYFGLFCSNQNHSNNLTGNPAIPIPSSVIDSAINQIAAGAGQNVSNGQIGIISGGPNRTTASDASVAALKAKGWTININGTIQ